ncbi:MAG: transporter substrate-binding domain-containing protein, partial [Firmicutes bacterium]|nr:transporter substrate-binding domain-containing protein [Bacillota bacterium]
MMKTMRFLSVLLISILVIGAFAPLMVYAEGEEPQNVALNGITTIEELNGKRLGVQTGVLYEDLIKDQLEDEEWLYYKLPNDMIPALENNKIDAYLIEEVGYYAQRYEHPELVRLDEAVGQCEFAVIVGNNDKQDMLFSQLQEFISDRKESGWLADLYDYRSRTGTPTHARSRTS